MTKAEKIFNETYTECRLHARTWGCERSENGKAIGFNKLATEEATSRRTWNAIQKLIDKERERIEFDKRLGIDVREVVEFGLEMVQETLNNTIRWHTEN